MTKPIEGLIPTEDAAKILGLQPQTLVAYRHEGRGPRYYKTGRRCLYNRSDLLAFIEAQAVDPGLKLRRKVA